MLLPLMLLPVIVPLLVGAVQASGAVIRGESLSEVGPELGLLVAFDLIFVTLSVLLFEYVLEE